jgi:hypothetical protein
VFSVSIPLPPPRAFAAAGRYSVSASIRRKPRWTTATRRSACIEIVRLCRRDLVILDAADAVFILAEEEFAQQMGARFLLHERHHAPHRLCPDRCYSKEPMMDLLAVLTDLAPAHDPELMEGYQRYVALLERILTPTQLDIYAALIQRTGTVRIFDELTSDELAALTPDEQVIVTAITADETATMENRRVAALLNQRGQQAVAPDLGHTDAVPEGS